MISDKGKLFTLPLPINFQLECSTHKTASSHPVFLAKSSCSWISGMSGDRVTCSEGEAVVSVCGTAGGQDVTCNNNRAHTIKCCYMQWDE